MSDNTNSDVNESILYEVLEYFVKKQEPELTKYKNDFVALPTPGTIQNALRYLNNRYSLPEIISQQISYTLPWKFAIGDKGRILAILQENIVEIRKSKDEYSSVVGKASAPKDAFPQWRKLVWSPDGSVLALASSNGYISFYNSFGNNIFNISQKSFSPNPDILEAGDAIASMIFKKPRVKSENWDYEFIRVTYSGLLKSYCISGNGFSENHEFSFGGFYRNGVNSVSYSERLNLFFVAGNSISQNLSCTASQIGLTCWRTLNDQPYYKLSVASQDVEICRSNFSIWNYIPVIKSRTQSIIFKTSISPNDQLISCLHIDGTISIWSLPNLKLQKQWKLSEQPNYNIENPLKTLKFKKSLENISEFQPLDIGWWSDNAMIIARYSGAVSVCSTNSLQNLLGASPEFLYNYPQVAELSEGKGFLCLDCEVIITSTKRNRESNSEELSSDSEKDEDESKPATLLSYTTNLVQSALYSMTDIERFQPKRKKSKVFHKTYRILGIKSTTPEELYSRKIEIEQYEEALALAKTYNLDPDLVYQTQWRKSEFSVNAILEHLSKVSKRSWVLNECVSRVPETLEATRELINFGLCAANLETLVAIGIDDDGKITSIKEDDDDDVDEQSIQLKQVKQMQKINKTLETIDIEKLNESQKELIRYRKKLLSHLDKLQTYEILLESPSKFDKKFYEEFRQLSLVENAVKYAKNCNYQGVEIMFTYYGTHLIPHWLTIISYFPETLNPELYQKLLPECDAEGRLFLLYQQELRQKDWVETSMFSGITDTEVNENIEYIYEEKKSLLPYRNKELTVDLLQKWYTDRAYEIERESRLVDNALSLINIGKSHNIPNLETLLFNLETLDDLVYKVGLEELSLTELEKLSDLDKIKLLMSKSNEKNFVTNIQTMLLPYSRRRKRYLGDTLDRDLMYDYLVLLSKNDLQLPVKFFEFLRSSYDPEILDAIKSVTSLAIDCLYACTDTEVYHKAKAIFDTTLIDSSGREDSHEKYQILEKELKCLQILNKYEVMIPLYEIKDSKQDPSKAKELLTKMSENLIKIYPQANEKHWSQLLNDMLDIQERTFPCLDIETCFEIVMLTRLKSRSKSAIQGCINLMELKKSGRSHLKVSYERAIDFILEISINYFNNSKSLSDPDMELAKECLCLISENNDKVKEEYDLMESLKILNEFNINILPLQLRMTQEKLKLIEDCLNSRRDAYKNKQKLLNLSQYLRIDKKNNRSREGKVLNLIARKAFEMNDYNFCSSIIKEMMTNNYQSAWLIAKDLAYCNEYDDLQFQKKCIWYAIGYGPNELIEDLIKRANLLEAQILNADLEKIMPLESENLDEEENTDSEHTDVYSTPLTENKEFVPKFVQTSTDLMKTSAQLVTQSTFGLLKNASNKDFWTSKLNFKFMEYPQKTIANDERIETKVQEEMPKFHCFYETIHKKCGISNLDTKYSKYSQDDYNTRLKLCQTLLRISLLSETASYGAEISGINHLLLECAQHTIVEDCLMGLSYLLDLNDDNIINIKDIFKTLPQTELYYQYFAYFYSIKLYSNLYPDCDKVFLYDPNKLILQMSNAKILNDNDYQVQLKQEINFLIRTKQEKEMEDKENKEKDNFEFSTTNELELKKESKLHYASASEETDEWGDWDDQESFKSKTNVNNQEVSETALVPQKIIDNKIEIESKSQLDYIPAPEEIGEWDDWEEKESFEIKTDIENDISNNPTSVYQENSNDNKTDVKIKSALDYVPSSEEIGEWDDWGDKSSFENKNNFNVEESKNNEQDNKIKIKSPLDCIPTSENINKWGDWDNKDNFKMKTDVDSEINEDIKTKSEENRIDQLEIKKISLDYNPTSEETDEWNNWGDEWANTSNLIDDNVENSDKLNNSLINEKDNFSDEKHYENFKEEFSKIQSLDDYLKVKQMLLEQPNIIQLNCDNRNLAIIMLEKIININTVDNNSLNEIILQEIKYFLQKELIPIDVLNEFLDKEKNTLSPEQFVFLQLCSKSESLQQKAIEYIKVNYKTLNLNSIILEEIFFNNLTSLFSVSHDLYYRILEEVFLNRNLSEIEDNVKLLIDNLIEQRNIPHAIALLNQLESIPPSLSTYSNCFELLLRKKNCDT